MATAGTTLARASFGNQPIGRINLKLVTTAGVAVGDTMTVTTASGAAITGTVAKFIGTTSLKLKVASQTRPSGTLLLPKGSTVA
jgi:hypothetical protein